jgi:hypothetical protein
MNARAAFDGYAALHNFDVRPNPDFDSWHSSVAWEPHPEVPAQGKYVGADVTSVLSERPDEPRGAENRQWLIEVSTAANADANWTWKLLLAAKEIAYFDPEFWQSLMPALALVDTRPSSGDIRDLVLDNPNLGLLWTSVERLLEGDPEAVDQDEVTFTVIDDVMELWNNLPTKEPSETSLSWALNTPRGKAASFVINLLSKVDLPQGKGIPVSVQSHLDRMFATASDIGDASSLVLSSQVAWLMYLDPDWTSRTVIPLFRWKSDSVTAAKAWAGFLDWGRWSSALFDSDMVDEIRTSYVHVVQSIPQSVRRYIEHHAYLFREPLQGSASWSDEFLRHAPDDERAEWLREVARSLKDGSDEPREVWDILRRYWRRRIGGEPVEISREESAGFFEWLFLPGVPFDEGAELFLNGPSPMSSWRINQDLDDLPISDFPNHSGRVILHLIAGSVEEARWNFTDLIAIAEDLWSSEPAISRSILLRLGELGNAAALNRLDHLSCN